MSYNPYEDVSIDNPLPCKEVEGTYTSGEDVSESNPFPVMVVDVDAYTKFEDVSEDNPQPIALDTGDTYTRFEELSDTNRKPVVIVEGQNYDPKQPISMTNPYPVIDTTAGGGGDYVGPLDLVPGAVVAYGVRALSAAMLGQNIFRLRRDSDDAEMDFAADAVTGEAPLAAIAIWKDAAGAADAFVVTWYDQSGSNNHVIQAAIASQPNFDPSSFAGASSVAFPSSGEMFLSSSGNVSFSGPFTTLCVANAHNYSAFCGENFGALAGDEACFSFQQQGADSYRTYFTGTSDGFSTSTEWTSVGTSARLDVDAIFEYVIFGAAGDIFLSGVDLDAEASHTAELTTINHPFFVGSDDSYDNGGSGAFAEIGELIVYATLVSSQNRSALRQNQAAYYGITLA